MINRTCGWLDGHDSLAICMKTAFAFALLSDDIGCNTPKNTNEVGSHHD